MPPFKTSAVVAESGVGLSPTLRAIPGAKQRAWTLLFSSPAIRNPCSHSSVNVVVFFLLCSQTCLSKTVQTRLQCKPQNSLLLGANEADNLHLWKQACLLSALQTNYDETYPAGLAQPPTEKTAAVTGPGWQCWDISAVFSSLLLSVCLSAAAVRRSGMV